MRKSKHSPLLDEDTLTDMVRAVANKQKDYEDLVGYLMNTAVKEPHVFHQLEHRLGALFSEIEQSSAVRDELFHNLDQSPLVMLTMEWNGTFLHLSPAARKAGYGSFEHIHQLGVTEEALLAFNKRLMNSQHGTLLHVKLPNRPMFLARYVSATQAIVLTQLNASWTDSIRQALQGVFSLSESEVSILMALSTGHSPQSIADDRASTFGTVRQQVKSILRKMGCRSQLEAITLACTIATTLLAHHSAAATTMAQPVLHELLSPSGRRIGYRRFGRQDGIPILWLHGPFFGAGHCANELLYAEQYGLSVIAPERPGYGRTDPGAMHLDPLQVMLDDIDLLVAHLGIPPMAIVSQELTLHVALHWATRRSPHLPIIGISAPLLHYTEKELGKIPPQQSVMLWAAKNARWMTRLLLRLGMVRLRRIGTERWYEAIFGEVPHDMKLLEQPDMAAIATDLFQFNTAHQWAGLELDFQVLFRDWTSAIKAHHGSLTLLHGALNRTTPVSALEAYQRLHPRCDVMTFPSAGQTLVLQHPDALWQVIYRQAILATALEAERLTTRSS